jgi:hypothetical protein
MTKEQNAKVGNMSNDELANMAYMHNNGMFANMGRVDVPIHTAAFQSSKEILQKFDTLEKAVKANKPAREKYVFDDRTKLLMHEIKTQGRTERNHMKKTGLFG